MEVIIRDTAKSAVNLVTRLIQGALNRKPNLVLGLATGRTMEAVYAELAQLHEQGKLDFSLCRTFNLDEYIGLLASDRNSYRSYMNERLFSRVNIDRRNTHLPDGMAADLNAECERYEALIRDCNGIDLQLLGIGKTGHIGFNEPLSALRSRTRPKVLTPVTIRENSTLFEDPKRMPRSAITMGVGTILECKRLLVLVTGKAKAAILAKAVEGPITGMVSASAIQMHPWCTVVCDQAAATKLKEQEYYRWIFANETEWAEFR